MNSSSSPYAHAILTTSFEEFATLFGSVVINNTITIPAKKGSGTIRKIDITEGLSIQLWDLRLQNSFHLGKPASSPQDIKSYSLFYIFSPENIIISHSGASNTEAGIPLKNTVFVSEEINLELFVKPAQPVRMIQVDITKKWLSDEFTRNGQATCAAYNNVLNNPKPILFTETASFDTCHAFANLLHHLSQESTDMFYLKAKTLSLMCDIFLLLSKQHNVSRDNNTLIHEKMLAVEKLLEECLESPLPSIGAIAKQMALSESTLKRNFKQLYGTSIYEFYLQKKMKRARQLFAERPVPVKEVAYQLGYEKVSNFIQMFKKYYHFSPGRLKKTTGLIENINETL